MQKHSNDFKISSANTSIPSIYYPNECFICKTSISLKRCSRCNMISYCGRDHQIDHWKSHKEICNTISVILKERKITHIFENCRGFSTENWRNAKKKISLEVETRLGRFLLPGELQMFHFPRACYICHDSRQELLKNCPGCTNASFCKEHPRSSIHDIDCPQIHKSHEIEIQYFLEMKISNSDFSFLSLKIVQNTPYIKAKSLDFPMSLKEFMQYAKVPAEYSDVKKLYIEEFLIFSLTTFGALQKLKLLSLSKLLIHTNNASHHLEDEKSWEILFHLMPNLTQLRIIMVSEEDMDKHKYKLCAKCRANKKKLSIQTIPDSYINYSETKDYEEPGLAIFFNQNPPLPGDNQEYGKMWKLMLMTWGIVNCPLVMLTITEEKSKAIRASIESTFNEVQIFYDGQNHFATRKPNRLWENERLFWDNIWMIIFKVTHGKKPLKCNRCGIVARFINSKTSKCAGCEADLMSTDAVLFPEQNDNRSRNFYYMDCCQVCHYRPDPREGECLSCKYCKLISYCNKDHQREHWPQHKDLCKEIFTMTIESGFGHIFEYAKTNGKTWLESKINLMLKVQSKLGRNLLDYEREIFLFPKACFICHISNPNILKTCCNCGIKLCEADTNSLEHIKVCPFLTATFRCDIQLLSVRQSPTPVTMMEAILFSTRKKLFETIPLEMKDENLPSTMDAFVNNYITLKDQKHWMESHPMCLPNLRQIVCSDIFSRSLTLFSVMKASNFSLDSMTVHIIGTNDDEKSEAGYLEILLHFIPNLKSLKIVFIGSDISELKYAKIDVCEGCLKSGKSLEIKGFALKYEEYFKSEYFVKPDIVVGYNLQIYESDYGLTEDTWDDTILTLTKVNAPFLMTGKTIVKALMSHRKLKAVLGKSASFDYIVLNLFKGSSLKRDFLTEKFECLNQFITLYTTLFELKVSETDENFNSKLERISENSELESILIATNLAEKEEDFEIGSLKI